MTVAIPLRMVVTPPLLRVKRLECRSVLRVTAHRLPGPFNGAGRISACWCE
jgi:hypothetical protein